MLVFIAIRAPLAAQQAQGRFPAAPFQWPAGQQQPNAHEQATKKGDEERCEEQ
jgi:hypothetical protein